MYTPSAFAENDPAVLHAMLRRYPLATLASNGADGLDASHLPLLYFPAEALLRGHMARANPQWQSLTPGTEVLAIFHGPQHYISPNSYPSKAAHGKVVPTWNYVAIHARGTVTVHQDAAWLLENVQALTDEHEAAQEHPWKIDDAPPDYIAGLTRAIVGVEISLTRLEGKWKVSQNRSAEDRAGVAEWLDGFATAEASAMRALVAPAPRR